ELLSQAEQEWRRAAAFEAIEQNRNRSVPAVVKTEPKVCDFLQRKGILTLPPGQQHFTRRAVPPYLAALQGYAAAHNGPLCASWKNPDPIRWHYYDSGANEGIGFYSEEMMLQSGLYDDSPHSREIVYNQMRLRALRVIADVNVALGAFTPQQA